MGAQFNKMAHTLAAAGITTALGAGALKLLLRYLFLPSQTFGRTSLDQYRAEFKAADPRGADQIVELTIASAGCLLDAVEWRNPATAGQSLSGNQVLKERWVVWLNANGVCLEELLLHSSIAQQYGGLLDASVLLWNYRGVGRSTGSSGSGSHLVQDATAVVQHLLDRGVQPQNILLHGHSMGGAVACVVAAQMKKPLAVISDRSFSSLKAVVKAHTRKGPLGAIICALVGALGAATTAAILEFGFGEDTSHESKALLGVAMLGLSVQVCGILWFSINREAFSDLLKPVAKPCAMLLALLSIGYGLPAAQHSSLGRIFLWLLAGEAVGLSLAVTPLMPAALSNLASMIGWRLDAAAAWPDVSGRKGVLYHKGDIVIDYTEASLQSVVKSAQAVELSQFRGQACHMYSLNETPDKAEWDRVTALAKSLLPST